MIHGILFDEGILTNNGVKSSAFQVKNIKSISDIAEIAKGLKLKLIYILNGSHIFNRLALNHRVLLAENQKYVFKPATINNIITVDYGRLQVIFCGALNAGSENNLAVQTLANQWALWEIKDAKRLYDSVYWLYKKLNVFPSNPQRTGKKLAEISANETLDPLNENTDIYHDNKANDLIFVDLSKLSNQKYIYGFDKNSAYANGARSYSFGLGDSILQKGGNFDKKLHGLWNIEIDKTFVSSENFKLIDLITDRQERFWTSDVEILIELGANIRVIDAQIWKYNKRIFEKFCKTLLDARADARDLDLIIESQSIKDIFTKFFGWMAKTPDGWTNIFYRPDWFFSIIAVTRANMIRNILTIRQFSDIEIIGCHRDELIISSSIELENLPYPLAPKEKSKSSPYKFSYKILRGEVENILKDVSSGADLTRKLKAYQKESTIKKTSDSLSKLKMSNVKRAVVNG